MNRRLSAALIIILLLTVNGEAFSSTRPAGLSGNQPEFARITGQSGSDIRIVFTPPSSSDLLFSQSSAASIYDLEEGYTSADGRHLPAVTYWVVVPPRDKVELEMVSQEGRRLSTDISAAADPYIDSQAVTLNAGSLAQADPPDAAVTGKPVIMRGVRMVPVTVYPLQLSGNEAFENRRVTVDLKLAHGDAENPRLSLRPIPMSDRFADIIDSYTLNPPHNLTPRRDPAATELARMLIMYPEAIDNEENEGALEWIDNFADWKRRQGLMVDIEPIDVEHNDAEDIKDVIRDYYDPDEGPPLEFLVIIGNEDINELEDARYENDVELFFPTYQFEIIGEDDTTTGYSDHEYSTLEGDDLAPDIIVSRIKVPTYTRLIGALQRTIEYEVNPDTDDEDWFGSALVVLEIDPQGGLPPVDLYALEHWEMARLAAKGYDPIELLTGTADPNAGDAGIQDEIKDVFETGVSVALAEGYLYGAVLLEEDSTDWGQFEDRNLAHTGRRNPFIIANFQRYAIRVVYPFFASAREDFLNGPVAAMGIVSDRGGHRMMTPIIGSAITAMTFDDVFIPGYLQLITKMHLLSLIQREDTPATYIDEVNEAVRIHWTLGDPSVDIFSENPVELAVEHPESYTVGETSVILHVTDRNENDVDDATVCVRQEDGIQYVAYSNAAGMAVFTVPEGLAEGELLITACKHNYKPYLSSELMVEEARINLALGDHGFDDSELGDDDGELRNGEQAELILSIANDGEGDAENVTGRLSCDSEWLSFDPAEIEFGDIPSGETVAFEGDAAMDIDPACPGGTVLRIQVDLEGDDDLTAQVAFEITTAGPVLTTAAHMIDIDENFIVGGENAAFEPTVGNIGDRGVAPFTATLSSPDERITITQAQRNYESIEPDGEASPNEPFRLNIDPLFLVGQEARFEMHITAEDGYDTTLTFSKIVPSREAGEPLGPDDYGYVCFDSEDYQWQEAPVYDWREINWNAEEWEFNGTKIDFEGDETASWNETTVIDLPFEFRYYGEVFDQITVATNGWIAPGALPDTAFVTSFNRPIPGMSSPDGQICVLWQNLTNNGQSAQYNGLFHHFIEDEGIFVVEWSRVMVSHRSEGGQVTNYSINFQILLLDPEIYRTETGDGEIIFQYKDFQAANSGRDPEHQYSTIGIRNLTGDGGLQYAYWNEYAPQAYPIENEFAIKFTPTVLNEYGSVTGRIVRFEDEEDGLANAVIRGSRLPLTVSDNDGRFRITALRVGHYTATVLLNGFNRSSFDFNIAADEETDVGNIRLTHPEFSFGTTPDDISELSLRPDGTELHVRLNIANSGNGPLEYRVGIVNQDSSDLSYRNIHNISLTQLLNEPDCYGGVFADSFYIPGTNDDGENGDGHRIYVVTRDGEYVRSFQQPMSGVSDNGMVNLAWDGRYLWGAIDVWQGDRKLFIRFDLQGNSNLTIDNPLDNYWNPSLVVNPENGHLFIADAGTGVVEIDTLGNIVNSPIELHRTGEEVRITGMGWNALDPDGMNLYLLEIRDPEDPAPTLSKVDLESGEWRIVTELRHNDFAKSYRGLSVMHDYSFERSVLALFEDYRLNNLTDLDSLRFYDLGPNLSFLEGGVISDRFGIIDTAGQAQAGLLINVDGYPEVDIPFGITITHNGSQPAAFIPVILHVDEASDIGDGETVAPVEFGINSVYPNPFNALTRIEFTIDKALPTSLKVYDVTGREAAVLFEGVPETGQHRLTWDGRSVSSGVYFLRLQSAGRVWTAKTAVVK